MARKMSNTTQSRQTSFKKGDKTLKKSSFLKRKNKKTLNSKKKKNTQGNRKGRLSKRKRLIKEGGGEYWGSENEPRDFTPLSLRLSAQLDSSINSDNSVLFYKLKTNNRGRLRVLGTRKDFNIWKFSGRDHIGTANTILVAKPNKGKNSYSYRMTNSKEDLNDLLKSDQGGESHRLNIGELGIKNRVADEEVVFPLMKELLSEQAIQRKLKEEGSDLESLIGGALEKAYFALTSLTAEKYMPLNKHVDNRERRHELTASHEKNVRKEDFIKMVKDLRIKLSSKSQLQELIKKIEEKQRPPSVHASEELLKDREMNDREIVMEAVKQDGRALEYATEDLKNDREIVMEAVKQNGYALYHASAELKGDRKIVMEAVKKHGYALKYASEELKNDPEIVMASEAQLSEAGFLADIDQYELFKASEARDLVVSPDYEFDLDGEPKFSQFRKTFNYKDPFKTWDSQHYVSEQKTITLDVHKDQTGTIEILNKEWHYLTLILEKIEPLYRTGYRQ